MDNQTQAAPVEPQASKSTDDSSRTWSGTWSGKNQVRLLVTFVIMLLATAYLFSLGSAVGGILGGLTIAISWFAIGLQMLGGPSTKLAVIAIFVILFADSSFLVAAPNITEKLIGTETTARITHINTYETSRNPQGISSNTTYATIVTPAGKPIHGKLTVTGDNYKVGDHVKVYYSPSGALGPVRAQDANANGFALWAFIVLMLFCLWPIITSVQATYRRYHPQATPGAPKA